jgi:tetratricopeptide (TPR) repeat protein
MKKTKRPLETKASVAVAAPPRAGFVWWPWALGFASIVLAFFVYGPAINGNFVLDDRYLPFMSPDITPDLSRFVTDLRPLLMFSFWIDYIASYKDPKTMSSQFHETNIVLHSFVSILAALIVLKILEWAGVAVRMRTALAIFCGALFLLHPLQTESVAYVASRSELLSVFFYYAAFAVFLYRSGESITLLRSIAVLVLFGAAVAVKEHTLTLPALLLLTDYYWGRGGIRKNGILYGLLAVAGVAGAAFVGFVLRHANTAGFRMKDMTPLDFFFTECRVLWIYLRMFLLPYGQNIDPDIPTSHSLLDHGAIFGFLALIALIAAAWIYRKQFPLASYGIFVFLLLIAPTSSIVPIRDPLAEHRLYLPFIGLLLVAAEFLRRLTFTRAVAVGAVALVLCGVLTYRRNLVWGSSLTLWQDSANKSPNKYRPRFQLAYAQFEAAQVPGNLYLCKSAVDNFQIASHLQSPTDDLLIDWGLALGCAGRWNDSLTKFREAAMINNTAHVHTQIATAHANLQQFDTALNELDVAQSIDPGFSMTYMLRGQIYEAQGDRQKALPQYSKACHLNPTITQACAELLRTGQ